MNKEEGFPVRITNMDELAADLMPYFYADLIETLSPFKSMDSGFPNLADRLVKIFNERLGNFDE